jgi:hypothetical protein
MKTPGNRYYAPRDAKLHLHRFAIELDVVTAGDLGRIELARRLADLSTAALWGIAHTIRRVELDGDDVDEARSPIEGRAHELRPAIDQRIVGAARTVAIAADELARVLGLEKGEPAAEATGS